MCREESLLLPTPLTADRYPRHHLGSAEPPNALHLAGSALVNDVDALPAGERERWPNIGGK